MAVPDGGSEPVDLDDDLDDDLDAGPELDDRPGRTAGDEQRPPDRRRRRRTAVLLGGLLVAVLAAAAVLQRTGAVDDERPRLDGSASAQELFPLLAGDAEPGSGFPADSITTSLALVPGSARRLGSTATATFWLARDDSGGVCLLARDTSDAEGVGGTCASAAEAARRGLRLPAGEGDSAVVVPDGFDTSRIVRAGYARIGSWLWVDADTARRAAEALVDAASVRTVVVPSGAHRGDDALPVFLTRDSAPYAAVLTCLQDARLRVSVDGAAPEAVTCGTDAAFVTFRGDGSPVRVQVSAPGRLVWAAAVVACTGSLLGPEC